MAAEPQVLPLPSSAPARRRSTVLGERTPRGNSLPFHNRRPALHPQPAAEPASQVPSVANLTVCVVDMGLFLEIARVLGRACKRVYYYVPWEARFPKLNEAAIGYGVEEIVLADSPFSVIDECDLFVFPDVYHGPLQRFLVRQGKAVWGSGGAERLELERNWCKQTMKAAGLPVGPYRVVRGVEGLREHLKSHPRQHVKLSKFRGHFESFFAKSYRLVEPRIDEIEWQLGPLKEDIEFTCEDDLAGRAEFGVDAYCVDGRLPERTLCGVEIKDRGFVGKVCDYAQLPEPMTRYDRAMAPLLERLGYRGFYSTEVRIGKDHVPYMIDACCRAASPPGELYQELYANLPQIIAGGAQGVMVQPEIKAPWGAELLLVSQWSDRNWQAVDFPPQYRQCVKLRNAVRRKGRWYVVPHNEGVTQIGAVIGYGQTRQQAVDMARRIAATVEGYDVEVFPDSLDQADEQIDKARHIGLDILGEK